MVMAERETLTVRDASDHVTVNIGKLPDYVIATLQKKKPPGIVFAARSGGPIPLVKKYASVLT